ncbi:MAG: FmdB family zinc ribbon protein [Bifidobacteriaceae bacterium]|nr:zinc ribbon domain-containing protein [Bifidobacteriaceae bacterium]MEE0940667.1 FmdB family zinc ribbon protein [Bifidobacteriaceae bacterium]
MPNYHYRCKNCNYDFVKHQSFDDDPIKVCEKCDEETVVKVFSAVPVTFKGSGFYRTDKGSSGSSGSSGSGSSGSSK